MVVALVLILGLVVGSFLNAVIYRLHAGVSFMKGRSYCPLCKHDLGWRDLVPVISFFMLWGKCRYCRKGISWQYPLVEIGTALTFLALYWRFDLSAEFYVLLAYASLLIIIFVYDLRYYLILDRVSIPAFCIAIVGSLFVLDISILSLVIGVAIGGGFFSLQYAVSRGKWIGGGDIRLGAVMGAMLGYQKLLIALFMAYVLGSLVGVGLIASHRKGWKSKVPFGTFLAAATILVFIFGDRILDAYTTAISF
ncbi:MAG: prepilin peptidase [Patescibacteria group bacterium]|nr:prepilin peptidase [Patescibacteria group bacterium]MDD5715418.1 prepilin peptidase [Patescibacteria group bacterium]